MKSEQEDLDKTSGFMEKHTRKKFGYLSNQHLIYQHSQSPPIHCSGVGHISEYLHVHVQESHDNHLICTLMLYNIHMVAHNRLFQSNCTTVEPQSCHSNQHSSTKHHCEHVVLTCMKQHSFYPMSMSDVKHHASTPVSSCSVILTTDLNMHTNNYIALYKCLH